MSFILATLALATGLAIAKPVNLPQSLPHYKRQSGISNGFGGNNFNFIDGFNNFNRQEQVIQIQEQNLQIIDNGREQQVVQQEQNLQIIDNGRQQVVQQVNQVLVVNQQQNGFNNNMNDLFRKSNFRNKNQDKATVIMVVQQIQVAIDDGRGNQVQQDIFAQSILVANRGARETQSVMIFEAKTLIAQDIIGGGNDFGIGGGVGVGSAGVAGASNGGIAMPTKTNNVQLFGAKPTWSEVAEDPAATLGGVWQAELEDLQQNEQDGADNAINDMLAQQEKEALDQAAKEQEQAANGEDANAQDANAEDANAEDAKAEDANAEDAKAQDANAEDAQKAAEEAQKAADEEAKKAADEEAKKQEEAAKQE